MPVNVTKSEIICQVENLINAGTKIIIYDRCDHDDWELLRLLCEKLSKREPDGHDIELWCREEERALNDLPAGNTYTFLRKVPSEQMNEVLNLYRLYDFSDKVTVITESEQYGSLFNYVKTGLLTVQEMVDALLFKM